MSQDLAERIVGTTPEEAAQDLTQGPLGNFDYVEQGSDAHASMLGFDGYPGEVNIKDIAQLDAVEMVFDFTGIKDTDVRRFKSERLRMLYANPEQPVPPGCPERWNPDAI